jgi:hypothetical protein
LKPTAPSSSRLTRGSKPPTPINFSALAKAVKPGATIFVGQYLFTGSETTSVWLEVSEVKGDDVVCVIKNTATLAGSLFTLHCSQIHIDLPTLSDDEKDVWKLSLSFPFPCKTSLLAIQILGVLVRT